jgi:hypothetical protein
MFKLIRPLYTSVARVSLACFAGLAISAPAQAMTLLDFELPTLTGLNFASESFEQAGYPPWA